MTIALLLALACSSPEPAPPAAETPSPATRAAASAAEPTVSGGATWGAITAESIGGLGLQMPTGGSATWTLPAGSGRVVSMDVALTSEEVTILRVLHRAGDEVSDLISIVGTPEPQAIRLDLPDGPGTLELIAEGVGSLAVLDPRIHTATGAPTVVLLFLDTTRADHLTPYGYDRDTTPSLATWAQGAAVFDQAHTVAPWTLPSVRAALTGEQPESWSTATPLPEQLAEAGFATRAALTNIYLTPTFGMDRGWGSWHYELKRPAASLVRDAKAWLEARAGTPRLLMLQFMDAHLPYREPKAFQGRWAEEAWDGPQLLLPSIRRVKPTGPAFAPMQAQIRGRYDQNLAYIDAQLDQLWPALPDDAVVVVFADHGEELWDHDGFEHGHTFHEEVMRVPLIVKAPGVQPGRVASPASLLDLAPTVLDLLDLPAGERDGQSLVPAMAGTPLPARPLVFGRPLYGLDGWGVLHAQTKWWSRPGEEIAFDLSADPGERSPLTRAGIDQARTPFEQGWNGPLNELWAFTLSVASDSPATLSISHPDGIARAWKAYAPQARGTIAAPTVADGTMRWSQGDGELPSSLYVQPAGDPSNLMGLSFTLSDGTRTVTHTVDKPLPAPAWQNRNTLVVAGERGFKVLMRRAFAPEPRGAEVEAWSPDATEALKALGYVQ